MITEVSPLARVVLDGSGNGRCSIGPPSGTKWALRLATLAVSTSTRQPQGFLYRGSASGPLELVDQTFTGAAASSGKVAGPLFYPGQVLWAVWTGGDAGATATLQAYGQQGNKSDPLPPSPLGEGFSNSTAVIRGNELQLGSSPQPRVVFGPNIPAPLANASPDFTWSEALIWYFNATEFYWQAIGTYNPGPFPIWAAGSYDTTNGVLFNEFEQGPGSGSINILLYGSTTYNAVPLTWNFRNGAILLDANVDLAVTTSPWGSVTQGRGFQGTAYTVAGTVATSVGGAEAAIAAWNGNSDTFTFKNNRTYRLHVKFGVANTNAGTSLQTAIVRIRKTVNSTAAQELGRAHVQTPGLNGAVQTQSHHFYVANTSGADITASLGLTIQRIGGANDNVLYGDANIPLSITVEDIGKVNETATQNLQNIGVLIT